MAEIGVKLMDGRFAGYANVYPMEWPAPDRIVCFEIAGSIAVADAARLDQALGIDGDARVYVKVAQSALADDDELVTGGLMVRGAAYEAEA